MKDREASGHTFLNMSSTESAGDGDEVELALALTGFLILGWKSLCESPSLEKVRRWTLCRPGRNEQYEIRACTKNIHT